MIFSDKTVSFYMETALLSIFILKNIVKGIPSNDVF